MFGKCPIGRKADPGLRRLISPDIPLLELIASEKSTPSTTELDSPPITERSCLNS